MSETSDTIDWGDLSAFVDRGHQYANAPIVEALIEVQVAPIASTALDALSRLVEGDDRFAADGGREELYQNQIVVGPEVSGERSHVGYIFRRADGQRVVQAHLDRFAYSCLPPYQDWATFRSEMIKEWARYRELSEALTTTRLAVRFVNRIDIPKVAFEIKDYLRTSVELSPYLPQQMSGFFMQVEIPLPNHGVMARITSSIADAPRPDWGSLLLDIDVYLPVAFDLRADDADDAIGRSLDVLRDAKNFVFESCITDATRGLID